MRANEFLLLEYNQAKTATVFGNKLLSALTKDRGNFFPNHLGSSKAYLTQKFKIGSTLDEQTVSSIVKNILSSLETADPTPNKEYTQWLAKTYSAGEGNIKLEDIVSKGADWLSTYDKMKKKNILPLGLRDINRVTFGGLQTIVHTDEFLNKLASAEDASRSKGKSEVLLDNSVVRIIHPQDIDANKYYGQSTTWCTAATNNNMFDSYNKAGPMFILLPKQPKYVGEKYQIHAASGQFMDQEDEPTDPIKLLTSRFGDILPIIRQADPTLSQMVLFTDDETLESIINQTKEWSMGFIHEKVTDWEVSDDYYYRWLKDNGYVDEEGDVKGDAPNYFEYNPSAEEYYNDLVGAVTLSPKELRDAADAYSNEYGEAPMISSAEQAVAFAVVHNRSRADKGRLAELAEWIATSLYIGHNNKVIRVGAQKSS